MLRVPSTDGVSVAIHELAGSAGHPIVLVAHATGFHGHAYLPIAKRLAPRWHTYGMDFRGHGDTPLPASGAVSWAGFGEDARAAATTLAALPGGEGGIVGFGHSMGGAGLLMAAAAVPGLFRLLVLFEPIVYPTDRVRDADTPNPLRDGARRRRQVFDSFDAAIANYASKPPMAAFDPDALDAYVRHGFRQDGDHVRLKCDPETEAETFHNGGNHTTWDRLGAVDVPVVVMAGHVAEMQPSAVAELAAAALPAGRFVLADHMDHFGPMTHVDEIAEVIARHAAGIAG
ncbi:MAG TPA: alpha/beta fold hydrolase [Ilumatobacteraceae bacterium]|nr:alpha/beta fold hydrolase [Ilumatobacteraceae bacterium]